MVSINDVYQSNYLSASDLQGKEPVVTITGAEMKSMNDGQAKLCIFVNNKQKGIILNKTNARAIGTLYGEETDRWIGKRIKLVTVWTDFQGKPVQAIRVIPPGGDALSAQAPIDEPPPPRGEDDYSRKNEDAPW